jgi:hypothetical protein
MLKQSQKHPLSREQVIAFEDHYVVCNRCATLVEGTAEYVEAMRSAAKKVRPEAQ